MNSGNQLLGGGFELKKNHQPTAHRASSLVRSQRGNRQSVPHRAYKDDAAIQGSQSDEQGSVIQFPINVQWYALCFATNVSGTSGSDLLNGILIVRSR